MYSSDRSVNQWSGDWKSAVCNDEFVCAYVGRLQKLLVKQSRRRRGSQEGRKRRKIREILWTFEAPERLCVPSRELLRGCCVNARGVVQSYIGKRAMKDRRKVAYRGMGILNSPLRWNIEWLKRSNVST